MTELSFRREEDAKAWAEDMNRHYPHHLTQYGYQPIREQP